MIPGGNLTLDLVTLLVDSSWFQFIGWFTHQWLMGGHHLTSNSFHRNNNCSGVFLLGPAVTQYCKCVSACVVCFCVVLDLRGQAAKRHDSDTR